MSKFHELRMSAIDGELMDFSQLKGQVCLVVNLASQ